jgi:hypothetical protein
MGKKLINQLHFYRGHECVELWLHSTYAFMALCPVNDKNNFAIMVGLQPICSGELSACLRHIGRHCLARSGFCTLTQQQTRKGSAADIYWKWERCVMDINGFLPFQVSVRLNTVKRIEVVLYIVITINIIIIVKHNVRTFRPCSWYFSLWIASILFEGDGQNPDKYRVTAAATHSRWDITSFKPRTKLLLRRISELWRLLFAAFQDSPTCFIRHERLLLDVQLSSSR